MEKVPCSFSALQLIKFTNVLEKISMGASHPVYRACTPCFVNAVVVGSGTAKEHCIREQHFGKVRIFGQ